MGVDLNSSKFGYRSNVWITTLLCLEQNTEDPVSNARFFEQPYFLHTGPGVVQMIDSKRSEPQDPLFTDPRNPIARSQLRGRW